MFGEKIERYAHSDVLRCYKSIIDLQFWDLKVVISEFIKNINPVQEDQSRFYYTLHFFFNLALPLVSAISIVHIKHRSLSLAVFTSLSMRAACPALPLA